VGKGKLTAKRNHHKKEEIRQKANVWGGLFRGTKKGEEKAVERAKKKGIGKAPVQKKNEIGRRNQNPKKVIALSGQKTKGAVDSFQGESLGEKNGERGNRRQGGEKQHLSMFE